MARERRHRSSCSAAGSPTTTIRTTSRSPSSTRETERRARTSRRPRPTASSRRPAPRRGRPPARRSTGSSSTRCSTRRSSFRSSTTWTTGSRAPACGVFSSAAPRPTSTTPSSARPRASAERAPARPDGRRDPPRARSPASSGPSIPPLCETLEHSEVAPSLFETLTRALDGTRIVPWIASEVLTENDGRRYRFRLRPGVRFHDGRRLTARDVRSSWERLLLTHDREPVAALAHPRRTAAASTARPPTSRASTSSRRASSSSTSRSPSPSSRPSSPTRRPRSCRRGPVRSGATAAEGVVGTGPFRIVSFDPGRRLELERNPTYWREGYPRCDGIVFRFGVSSRGDPQRVPRREVLARRRPAPRRRRSVPARSPVRLPLPGEPAPDDLLRDVQHAAGARSATWSCAAASCAPSTSPASSAAPSEGSPFRRTASSRRACSATRRRAGVRPGVGGLRLRRTAPSRRRSPARRSS